MVWELVDTTDGLSGEASMLDTAIDDTQSSRWGLSGERDGRTAIVDVLAPSEDAAAPRYTAELQGDRMLGRIESQSWPPACPLTLER